MPRTTTRKPEELRRLILDTALTLFSRRGYFNTSVHDVRRAAEVSTGAIYHHFGSKEAIARALFGEILERMARTMGQILLREESAHDRCRAVVETLFRMAEEEPEILAFALYAKHKEFMPEETPVCSSEPFEMMRDMVRQGIERGEILPLDPVTAAASLFGGPLRLISLRLDGVLDTPLPTKLEESWACAWRAVAA